MIEEQKQPATNPEENQESSSTPEVVVEENQESPASVNDSEVVTNNQEAVSESDISQEEVASETVVENEPQTDIDQENAEIITALQQENANLKKLLDEKTLQSNGFKGQYARLAADFENFRRRTATEKENLEKQAKKNVITHLLPVVDNFERARVQIKPNTEGEKTIHNSYQGVYKTLVDCLKRMGVSAMRPEGQEFDPNYHEAMLREATDEYPEGTVIEQLMRGYTLGEEILRHAMVKVAVPIEPVITSEEEQTIEENSVDNTESVS
ncbi:Protein GrpE [Hyella patelloides LEGE 07179]|uniref:Protein GrpE n=1 Tax=Hyella patelloides LEGE 07179 TaxID=945734 RepID=A0A563VNK4_9CYAN|nr:nucleotide exchange factor GrpE [Hyella patelloides]VEP12947.1 Protein GrpE [Hyella patelloides LEGE 07179]